MNPAGRPCSSLTPTASSSAGTVRSSARFTMTGTWIRLPMVIWTTIWRQSKPSTSSTSPCSSLPTASSRLRPSRAEAPADQVTTRPSMPQTTMAVSAIRAMSAATALPVRAWTSAESMARFSWSSRAAI